MEVKKTDYVHNDIFSIAHSNAAFRKEVVTGENAQVTVMTLSPNQEIGEEMHHDTDQVTIIVTGEGKAEIGNRFHPFRANDMIFIPAGTTHNIINTGLSDMKIIIMYGPPHHEPGTVHESRIEADRAEAMKKTIHVTPRKSRRF